MAEYFSPGVYIEEYDNSSRSIEGVGTSTAGFVGLAEKGPTAGAPSLVTNFKSFIKQFGGFLSEFTHGEYRYLANSVEQFFVTAEPDVTFPVSFPRMRRLHRTRRESLQWKLQMPVSGVTESRFP